MKTTTQQKIKELHAVQDAARGVVRISDDAFNKAAYNRKIKAAIGNGMPIERMGNYGVKHLIEDMAITVLVFVSLTLFLATALVIYDVLGAK